MEDSRLIRQISDLDTRERERFHQFVNSPYFNQHKNTSRLLDLILKQLRHDRPMLSREQVFAKLFPGEDYREQAVFDLMSYLLKLYYRFIAQEEFQRQEGTGDLLALEFAYNTNRFDLLKNRIRRLQSRLDEQPVHDANHYWTKYRLYHAMGYYRGQYENRASAEEFQRMLDGLDHYYLVEKLRNACHLTANMMIVNTHYDFAFLDPVLGYIERELSGKLAEELSIKMYYTILHTMREPDNAGHYRQLRHLLDHERQRFSLAEQNDLFKFANNYCIIRINKGDDSYRRELFELYRLGLTSELLLNNGVIEEWQYKNITSLGCAEREYAWTEDFLERYRENLPPNKQQNAYTFNKANFYFHQKMYDEAEELLINVQFSDVVYHLSATLLRVRILYEKHDTETLLNLLETFRLYIIRNRNISTNDKKSYTNFLRFAKKVALLRHQVHALGRRAINEQLQLLHEKIKLVEPMAGKDWLLRETRVQPIAASS